MPAKTILPAFTCNPISTLRTRSFSALNGHFLGLLGTATYAASYANAKHNRLVDRIRFYPDLAS